MPHSAAADADASAGFKPTFWWQDAPPGAGAGGPSRAAAPPLAPAVAPPQPSAPPSRPPDAGSGRAGKPTASERVAARVAEENAGASLERALLDLERMAEGNPDLQEALASIQRGPDGAIAVGSLRRAEATLRERYAEAEKTAAKLGGRAPPRRGAPSPTRRPRRAAEPSPSRAKPKPSPSPSRSERERSPSKPSRSSPSKPPSLPAAFDPYLNQGSSDAYSGAAYGKSRDARLAGTRLPAPPLGGDASPARGRAPVRLEDRPDWDPSPAKSPARARSRSGSPGRATRKSWPPLGDPLAAHGDWPPGARATPPRKSSPSRGGRSGSGGGGGSPGGSSPGARDRRGGGSQERGFAASGTFFGSSLADRVPTVSAYVDRHADPAARAFAGFAGASGRAERDAALGWLRRFCGDDAAPPAEMAEILAAMDARARDEGVEDVSFEELREMLGLAGEDGGVPGRNASGVVPVPSAREAERRSAERQAELRRGGDAEPEWQSLRAGRGVPNEARASSDDARASSFSLAGPDVPLASPSPSPSRLAPLAPLVDPAVEVLDLDRSGHLTW